MECPSCGFKIRGKALFCPNCGSRLEYAKPSLDGATLRLDEAEPLTPTSPLTPVHQTQKQGCGMSLTVLAIATVVIVAILGLGAAGIYYGLKDRSQVEHQAAEEHYNKGIAYMEQGEIELAIREFETVLVLEPKHDRAIAKLSEAREVQKVATEPTVTATSVSDEQALAKVFDDLRIANENRDWATVLTLANEMIARDPTYRRAEVDQILFGAYYASGQELLQQDRMKEALRFFDRALQLQPDHAEVQQARKLAVLYMNGMAYWGADWATTLENLVPLYQMAPNYKDVRQRTHDAYVYYGDFLAEREDWCAAEKQYGLALEIVPSAALFDKRQDTIAYCSRQPSPPAADTTLTPGAQVNAPAGTFVGDLADLIEIEQGRMYIRGRVLDKDNKGVGGTRVQIQAWDWKTVAVTDGAGNFAFDGLANPVTYTLTLLDLPSLPFDVAGQWGRVSMVEFHEAR